eukprot:CAMPEP_0194497732 /NCGR_PEP_ID=MMETSP0253-20130528/14584_1 /TAXON_ID=2966 /ORGANISM="Noctiluca scintillans" /LENGTH=328 /DNA_ID=CAMNT_0039339271 /DNA_START=98 /DNA_END=1085 /DNA_ORIENTATION=+
MSKDRVSEHEHLELMAVPVLAQQTMSKDRVSEHEHLEMIAVPLPPVPAEETPVVSGQVEIEQVTEVATRPQTLIKFILSRYSLTFVCFVDIAENEQDPTCCSCCSSMGLSRADRVRMLFVGVLAALFVLSVPAGRFAIFSRLGGLLVIDAVIREILRTPDYRYLNQQVAQCFYYGLITDVLMISTAVYVWYRIEEKGHYDHFRSALELWVYTRLLELMKLFIKWVICSTCCTVCYPQEKVQNRGRASLTPEASWAFPRETPSFSSTASLYTRSPGHHAKVGKHSPWSLHMKMVELSYHNHVVVPERAFYEYQGDNRVSGEAEVHGWIR